MTTLLVYKEHMKKFYARYEVYLTPLIKFLFALITFIMLNVNVGYMSKLKNPIVVLILALLCSFLPTNLIVVIGAIFMVAHMFALSMELAAITFVILVLMYLLYYRFSPNDSYVVLLTPITFWLKIPYVMPLSVGLVKTPVSAVSVGFGTLVYYLIAYVKANHTMIAGSESDDIILKIKSITESIINNKEMLLTVIAFTTTIVIVYIIKRLSVDYSWFIAMAVGSLTNILILLIGDFMLNVSNGFISLILGTIAAICIAVVLQFFLFNVDYTRTEHVQFEDDEYYYYVKAVPKMTVTTPDKKVQRINPQRKQTRRVRED